MSPSFHTQRRAIKVLIVVLAAIGAAPPAWPEQAVSFQQRFAAQEAIERVYYQHRLWPKENPGPKPSFEQLVPKSVIMAKVSDMLKKSAALEEFWHRPITARQLQAEMDRMVRDTKDSDTLREIFAALNNDPLLIAECLARPILADRLARNWYAYDSRFHGAQHEEANALQQRLTTSNFSYLAPGHFHAVKFERADPSVQPKESPIRSNIPSLDESEFEKASSRFPAIGGISTLEETAEAFVYRWTERRTDRAFEGGLIVFNKIPFEEWFEDASRCLRMNDSVLEGDYSLKAMVSTRASSDPDSPDSWKSLWYVPEPRYGHTAVWTGTEMIVWGGVNEYNDYSGDHEMHFLNSGGRYDPILDTWAGTSVSAECPDGRTYHTAVWTGVEMIIWGGMSLGSTFYFSSGGRYNPISDSWIATSAPSTDGNCPLARISHTAVWTGMEMIVWGGENDDFLKLNTGGRYNPLTNTWVPTNTDEHCPTSRANHSAIWSDTKMIIWGGSDNGVVLKSGGQYDPISNSWTVTAINGYCPSARAGHTAVWTGTVMIVWGGETHTGGRYNPSLDSWLPTSTGNNVPMDLLWHTAVWTGTEMIVWGGWRNSGGRYNPLSDSWIATSTEGNCPLWRYYHTAVWTGSEMIVWGGDSGLIAINSGGRYSPASDSWVGTTQGDNCPPGRYGHTAVWTGAEMVVWGGLSWEEPSDHDPDYYFSNSGGRYYPPTDSWLLTSKNSDCPLPRFRHSAIWTGVEIIVWGGQPLTNSGGRYNPITDAWTPVSAGANCLSPRYAHTAIWTGSEMIVWGGRQATSPYPTNTGGRYDPLSDAWISTNLGSDCPSPRYWHSAVWTGTHMIVYGGIAYPSVFKSGGSYDPISDSWTSTSTGDNCPSYRYRHAALWTGSEMIIWGGYLEMGFSFLGGRYNPLTDSWTAFSISSDSALWDLGFTAIWTGTEMILWGAEDGAFGDTQAVSARYNPTEDSWTATPQGENCPISRSYHSAVWTGESMIIWDGAPVTQNGGIFFPNTPPRSLPTLSTSAGGDSAFTLGTEEKLVLDGAASTDGSNPFTTTPFHDKLDSLVSYEWDLNGDAQFDTQCDASTTGVDMTGPDPELLTDDDLKTLGIASAGNHPVWLRVKDEVGVARCTQAVLAVSLMSGPGEVPHNTLRVSKSSPAITLAWGSTCGVATDYTIYEGTLNSLRSGTYDHESRICTDTGADRQEVFTPAVGNTYYLVVPRTAAGVEGGYGSSRPQGTDAAVCGITGYLPGVCE